MSSQNAYCGHPMPKQFVVAKLHTEETHDAAAGEAEAIFCSEECAGDRERVNISSSRFYQRQCCFNSDDLVAREEGEEIVVTCTEGHIQRFNRREVIPTGV